MNPDDEHVLDSSAIIALLRKEIGFEIVQARIRRSLVSAVNQSEVAAYFAQRGESIRSIRLTLSSLGMLVHVFDQAQALEAARLRPLTMKHGLSLGDRACLALASLRSLPVMTADRNWSRLDIGIDITVIR